MHQPQSIEADTHQGLEPDDWFERCQYWQAAYDASIPTRKRRERQTAPLILTGNGLSIRVDRGALWIKDGLTHYPQERREHRFFPGGLEKPPRIVLIDGSGQVTLDALDWLAEQDIPLIRLRWDGSFASVVTSGGQATDPEKVRWQYETRHDPEARLEFARGLIIRKARATLETLDGWLPEGPQNDKAKAAIFDAVDRLETGCIDSLSDALGIEGEIANAYFRVWQGVEVRWKGTKRDPIPDEWRTFHSRSALRAGKPRNRNATHPVNAMLNYVYGMLAARKQIEAIAEGYDPTLGIVHDARKRDRGRTPAYALDMMESERSVVDRKVLTLLQSDTLHPADFTLSTKGTCRVGPELARLIAQEAAELTSPYSPSTTASKRPRLSSTIP